MTRVVEFAGLVVIVGVTAHVVVMFALTSLRKMRSVFGQGRALRLFREQAQIHLDAARTQRDRSQRSWEGYRKFEISSKVREARDVFSFYLKPHDQQALPSFDPGQHLTFRLRVPDQNKPVVRCYSLSDSPVETNHYRVTIKRLAGRDSAPPGVASSHFCENLNEGDIVDVMAPSGQFLLDMTRNRPVVLLAAGVGLTPLLSMLLTVCASGTKREVWLFYGVRNQHEHVMADELRVFAKAFEFVHLVVCYSQPTRECEQGTHFDHEGVIGVELLRRVLPSSNFEYYICGPPAMMKAVIVDLKEWQVPDSDINFEAFGAASARPVATESAAESCEVVFSRSNRSCTWTKASGSLLDLAENEGVVVDWGCRAGSCGSCSTAVKEGDVEHSIEPGARAEEGSCLICIAEPRGRVVLDA